MSNNNNNKHISVAPYIKLHAGIAKSVKAMHSMKRLNTCKILKEIFAVLECRNSFHVKESETTRMFANAQRDGHLAEHRWRPLFNAAKFG